MAAPANHEKLKSDLASSREALAAYVGALRQDFDYGAKLKRAVRNNPLVWYAGAALVGLVLSRVPPGTRRRTMKLKSSRPERSSPAGYTAMALTVLKFALDFAKPALLRWVKDRYLGTGQSPRGRN